MRDLTLVVRNLNHYRRATAAVVLGSALATAVLVGAFVVGDSVRGSLRALVATRFGPISHVLQARGFLPADLAGRLAADPALAGCPVVPALLTRGYAPWRNGRVGRIQVVGADLEGLAPGAGRCYLNITLAERLGVGEGDPLELRLPGFHPGAGPSPLARRVEPVRVLRLTVARVIGEPGVGRSFSLQGGQRPVRNCWVDRRELARALDREGKVTTLFAAAPDEGDWTARLSAALARCDTLADHGLRLVAAGEGVALESERVFLPAPVAAAARALRPARAAGEGLVTVHLVNTVWRVATEGRPERQAPYAMAAGLERPPGGDLGPGEVALNRWAAKDLQVRVGDRIGLRYYLRDADGTLAEEEAATPLKVVRILPDRGLAVASDLVPAFPGLTDMETMGEWDPPADLGVDLKRVRPLDERYWEKWRAAPRIFVGLNQARHLWADALGGASGSSPAVGMTSYRLPAAEGERFGRRLLESLDPAALGLAFLPLRRLQMGGAVGSTDFTGLFVGFSFFIIISAALLAALLFRLHLEDRAPQTGLLGALGFAPGRIGRQLVLAGLVLAGGGGLLGVPLGLAWAALMVAGLDSLWAGAVGRGYLALHPSGSSLLLGGLVGWGLTALVLVHAARRESRRPLLQALAGAVEGRRVLRGGRPRRTAWVAGLALLGGVALPVLGLVRPEARVGAFFGAGALLLTAWLAGLGLLLHRAGRQEMGGPARRGLALLALRGAGRRAGRSLLTAGLVGAAAFVLVIVSCLRRGTGAHTWERASGAGGYTLIAEFDLPLPYSPATPAGRKALGLEDEPFWGGLELHALRGRAGEELSCLNLYRPGRPRVSAVPDGFVARGGFTFTAAEGDPAEPWRLLEASRADGQIPVVADAEAAQWTLHKGLGDTVTVTDEAGRERQLRLVGLVAGSIFQGELLMGRRPFTRLFPSVAGFDRLLVAAPPETVDRVKARLVEALGDFGPTLQTTDERLALYAGVAGTYMAAFQALGSLGLLLGLAGLAVVMLRTLGERRQELALLAALGFSRGTLVALVVGEQGLLLLGGLVGGSAAALVAALPALLDPAGAVDPGRLVVLLAGLAVGGLVILTATARLGLRPRPAADLG